MLTKELTKEQLKEALLAGKCIVTRTYGSSERYRMKDGKVVVTPRIGGREFKECITYDSFDTWYAIDILPYPDHEIEIE